MPSMSELSCAQSLTSLPTAKREAPNQQPGAVCPEEPGFTRRIAAIRPQGHGYCETRSAEIQDRTNSRITSHRRLPIPTPWES